jgi:NAD(P)-dependent dehydrogenase (short-subunit alcohol dehydrogenase family)
MTQPHDRIALVTGAGSGIGRATAQLLVEGGWRVVLSGRRVAALQESIALCGDPFGDIQSRALAVPADITRPDAVAGLFDVVRARFGRLDLLFNNAGVATPATPLEDLPLEQWRAVVETHLTGAFLCTQEAFRIMKAQTPRGGRIVNRGAIPAPAPRPHAVAATATQHAMLGLTKACAQDGRAHDIAVGQIDVGHAGNAPGGSIDAMQAARSVLHMVGLPLQANVLFMAVVA